MASLATNVSDLATAVATAVKDTRGRIGDLASLSTTAKTNVVAAVNEVDAAVDALSGSAAGINDAVTSTTSTWSSQHTSDQISSAVAGVDVPVLTDLIDDTTPSTTTVYSSTHTDAQIDTAVNDLIGSAPGTLDTLGEIAAALQADESGTAAINTALTKRVAVDAAQVFTTAEQAQGRSNIAAAAAADLTALTDAVGATDTDFATIFQNGLA